MFAFLYRLYNRCLGVDTMSNSNKITSLKTLSIDLLDKTLAEIRLHRKGSSPPNEEYFFTAEYLLQEAMEYVAGAWEMIESGKSNASIALSRWVLEASLNLHWTVADSDKINERHLALIGEALRSEACLLEDSTKLWPDKSQLFKRKAAEARKIRKDLCVEKLESLNKRLRSIKEQPEKTDWAELYPLYRVCCAAAHPSLKVWERYNIEDKSTIAQRAIFKQSMARWMVTTSTYYLVLFTCSLTKYGDSKQLKHWWENKVGPLLKDD